MRAHSIVRRPWDAVLFAGALLACLASGAAAQTTTGSLRGYVTTRDGTPVAGAEVQVENAATGATRRTISEENGFYNLPGLTPGTYELTVRNIGFHPQTRPVTVRIGQTLRLGVQLVEATFELPEVVVTAAEPAIEMRTTEVATNVTQAEIEQLPSPSRNFLDLAALAPGTRVTPDRINGTGKTFSAGAQTAQHINVFIDGVSYKNDLINGGIAGQDASRGNPFPRNAIQEYRIITNNFKAEYQKASSAIISTVTKSGTNEWTGSAFFSGQSEAFVALDSFSRAQQETNPDFTEPDYSRYLFGLSAGGPLIRDKLFVFGAYEANYQDRQGRTLFNGDPTAFPAPIAALNGDVHTSPFRSNLFLGKLTYEPNDRHQLEFSGDWRHETDERGFGGQFACACSAFQTGETFRNDVATGRLKHSYFGSDWLNEALVSYQWYHWHPEPFDFDTPAQEYVGFGRIGGRDSRQDLTQKRLSLRNDFTYSGWQAGGSHVIKVGANVDFLDYDVIKELNENPLFFFESSNNFQFPVRARYGTGDPDLSGTNTQFGIYAQDDWSPTSRLTISAGIRWDYESGMYNLDYVTPQNVRDSILAVRDQLFVDIDPDRYFTDGDDREAFTGAFQPRLGVSYALDDEGRTTLFGAFGIFYDRTIYNATLDETYRRQHPIFNFNFAATANGDTLAWDPSLFSREGLDSVLAAGQAPPSEVFLIPNDLKPPRSTQWSFGIRHDFGGWFASVTYSGTRSKNGFSFEWANLTLNDDNKCCNNPNLLPAYQNVLVANNDVRTWYDALYFRVDRPYRRASDSDWGWGAGIAYTLADAEAEGGDLFSFPQVALNPRHPIDERHRIVANWVTDIPYLWGIQFSGLITLGSGQPFNKVLATSGGSGPQVTQRGAGEPERFSFVIPDAFAYRTVDLRFGKELPSFGGSRMTVTADLINAFNYDNFGCFNQTFSNDGVLNPDFGNPGCVISDPRRFQLGVQYDF